MKKYFTRGLLVLILSGMTFIFSSAKSNAETSNGKGRAQLWADNCARCHNMIPAETYSNAEWEVAVQHMRVRAGLTAKEYREILEFLRSGD